MRVTKGLQSLLIALTCLMVGLPAQAAMVGTSQLQADWVQLDLVDVANKRDWMRAQLVTAGVEPAAAELRVAAMTDSQVLQLHQRIDGSPAGGNALAWIVVILLATELTGVTDIIPAIRPID